MSSAQSALLASLRTLVDGPPWWQERRSTCERAAAPLGSAPLGRKSALLAADWSSRDPVLIQLENLLDTAMDMEWRQPDATEAVVIITRLLRRPSTLHAEILTCLQALTQFLNTANTTQELLQWSSEMVRHCRCPYPASPPPPEVTRTSFYRITSEQLDKLHDAGTERAARLELSILQVLQTCCYSSAGRQMMMDIDSRIFVRLCGQEVLGGHALRVLQGLAVESKGREGSAPRSAGAPVEPRQHSEVGGFGEAVSEIVLAPNATNLQRLNWAFGLHWLCSPEADRREVLAAVDSQPGRIDSLITTLNETRKQIEQADSDSGQSEEGHDVRSTRRELLFLASVASTLADIFEANPTRSKGLWASGSVAPGGSPSGDCGG